MHDSSGNDLDTGVEVLFVIEEGGEKTIDVMVVIAGSENVDDNRGELADAA